MAIKATKSKEFPVMEAGAYPARIYQILHIGTIVGYKGQLQNKVNITFEFPTELVEFNKEKGEQPRVISEDFTLSFGTKANLRKVIDTCDPKALKIGDDGLVEEYDVEKLIGKTCLVTVINNPSKDGSGKVYANMDNYTVLPKGMTCPPAINEPKVLNYDNFDKEYFMTLPTFLQDKIRSSKEYHEIVLGEKPQDITETDPLEGMEAEEVL